MTANGEIVEGFSDFDKDFIANLKGAAASAIASLVVGEIIDAIGLDGTVAGDLVSAFATTALSQVGTNILNGAKDIFAIKIDPASIIGTYIAGELSSKLVPAETTAGAIMGSIGSIVGSVLLPGPFAPIGSFIGQTIGTFLGNLFGRKSSVGPIGHSNVNLGSDGKFRVTAWATDNGLSGDLVKGMGETASTYLNNLVENMGGAAYSAPHEAFGWGHGKYSTHPGQYIHNSYMDAVEFGVLRTIKGTRVEGGSLYVKRAILNSTAKSYGQLLEDIAIAQDYQAFIDNRDEIESLISAAPDSSFTVGWYLTLSRAQELKLDDVHPLENISRFGDVVASHGENLAGVDLSDIMIRKNGNGFELAWKTDKYSGVPFELLPEHKISVSNFSSWNQEISSIYFDDGTKVNIAKIFEFLVGNNVEVVRLDEALDSYFAANAGKSNEDLSDELFENWQSGSNDEETLLGTKAADVIHGLGGDDTMDGGDGHDRLFGGIGDDLIYGADGDDKVYGQAGADLIYGNEGNDRLEGGHGDDIVFGGEGNDLIRGDAGNWDSETVFGDDYLSGGAGNDTLEGGDGADTLIGGVGNDTLSGGAGDDIYHFDSGDGQDIIDDNHHHYEAKVFSEQRTGYKTIKEEIWRGKEQSWLQTRYVRVPYTYTVTWTEYLNVLEDGDHDTITFGEGIHLDQVVFQIDGQNLVLYVRPSAEDTTPLDQIENKISIHNWMNPKNRVENIKFAHEFEPGKDTLTVSEIVGQVGTQGVDTFTWTETPVVLKYLNEGDDTITTGDGNDFIMGGAGNDTLSGGAGNDTLFGGEGNDRLDGGADDDILLGDAGADVIIGGAGADTASYKGSDGGVTVSLETNSGSGGYAAGDTLSGIENLTGSDFDDVLIGNSGDNIFEGLGGSDTMIGGEGADTVSYENSREGVHIDLSQTSRQFGGDASYDVFTSIENLTGSNFGDVLKGTDGDNVIFDGAGNDQVFAGAGEDEILAGAGRDQIDGGEGYDSISYAARDAGVVIDLSEGTLPTGGESVLNARSLSAEDELISIERATGTNFADVIIGSVADNAIAGLGGDDTIVTGAGDDMVAAGDGNDLILGGAGADTIDGGDGIDTASYQDAEAGVSIQLDAGAASGAAVGGAALGDDLSNIENLIGSGHGDSLGGDDADNVIDGGAGDDTILGGAGDDWIIGGAGADSIDGGAGIDTVDYSGSDSGVIVDMGAGTAENPSTPSVALKAVHLDDAGDMFLVTPAADGDRTKWTFATWVNLDRLNSSYQYLFSAMEVVPSGANGYRGDRTNFLIDEQGRLDFFVVEVINGNEVPHRLTSSAAVVTPGEWVHVSAIYDSNADNLADRMQISVNGQRITSFFRNSVQLSKGHESEVGMGGVRHGIGGNIDGGTLFGPLEGQLAETHYIDGEAVSDDRFFEIDAEAVPQPIIYAGEHGGNGFHLNYEDGAQLGGNAVAGADLGINGTPTQVVDSGLVAQDLPLAEGIGGDAQGDVLSGVENLVGSDFDDSLSGSSARNEIRAGAGDDTVFGGAGRDSLWGDDGNDILAGGEDSDRIDGGSGDDSLTGGEGNDILLGGAGNDYLSGGTGGDLLDGGAGNDRLFAGDKSEIGDEVNAVRLDGVDDMITYTPESDGDRTKWTFTSWVNLDRLNESYQYLFSSMEVVPSGANGYRGDRTNFLIDEEGRLDFFVVEVINGEELYHRLTSSDAVVAPGEWVHVSAIYDSNADNPADRMQISVNGQRITSFFRNSVQLTKGHKSEVGMEGVCHGIGGNVDGGTLFGPLEGVMADVHYVDGAAVSPVEFGRFEKDGTWVPEEYAGSHGENGFHLEFEDGNSLTNDSSANGHGLDFNGQPVKEQDSGLTMPPMEGSTLFGGEGDDTLYGGDGDDILDGGDGQDVAVFAGNKGDYIIQDNYDGSVTVISEATGADYVSHVESLQFDDGLVDLTTGNLGPQAADAKVVLDGWQTVSHKLSASDADSGDTLTYEVVGAVSVAGNVYTLASGAEVTVNADGSYSYDPKGNSAADSFTWKVTDTAGLSSQAVITVSVGEGNPDHYGALDESIARHNGYGSLSADKLTYTGSGSAGQATYSIIWYDQWLEGKSYWETEIVT
ncbi:LamG-like jellyroll fold domain-containing protein, partial [Aestuariispira insulae]|uniref:LamG-like jellyroll fold domain-containing protein n=1 Tax=Aestuariispira insulae TaxID=1461337 RepID=UPI002482AD96